jgi:maltooligosyltrehalose trehalohydrolase
MRESTASAPAWAIKLGSASPDVDQARFLVWAPFAESVEVHVFAPEERSIALATTNPGYFGGTVEGLGPGTRYKYRLNGASEFPDPASRLQPDGVHGPSEIVSGEFEWSDSAWTGIPLSDLIFYELHIGTFTKEGTFSAATQYLDYLADLGITAIELMPVAQFPGARNWGYDGVFPFAVQNSYGGPDGLKRFVDSAHRRGLAVVLDVIYNHLGPEGNYLSQFGPYFTDRYQTPWGPAVNFDGEGNPGVRRFVIENALQWVTEFHIDALRVDAVHAIFDDSQPHILQEVADALHMRGKELGRQVHMIAESDLNDSRVVEPVENNGYGFDAQWSDDFHHALHSILTKERAGYYQDFGSIRDLARSLSEGFVYSGQFSTFRGRAHGAPSKHLPAERFVVCSQNHDQIGNRMLGERFSQILEYEQLKLAAGALVLSPFLPLLFMGQEYGERAPFLYFVSHSDPALVQAVREGRPAEFAAFSWRGEVPDPQAESTFERSRLDHALRESGRNAVLLNYYKQVIRLRRDVPALRKLAKGDVVVDEKQLVLAMHRQGESDEAVIVFHFGENRCLTTVTGKSGQWRRPMAEAAGFVG